VDAASEGQPSRESKLTGASRGFPQSLRRPGRTAAVTPPMTYSRGLPGALARADSPPGSDLSDAPLPAQPSEWLWRPGAHLRTPHTPAARSSVPTAYCRAPRARAASRVAMIRRSSFPAVKRACWRRWITMDVRERRSSATIVGPHRSCVIGVFIRTREAARLIRRGARSTTQCDSQDTSRPPLH
jgi:hypothetical protein